MTTAEEARADLTSAPDALFPLGQWEEILQKLYEAYAAQVLTGQEQGEVAFYLGEACLNTHRLEAESYMRDARRTSPPRTSARGRRRSLAGCTRRTHLTPPTVAARRRMD